MVWPKYMRETYNSLDAQCFLFPNESSLIYNLIYSYQNWLSQANDNERQKAIGIVGIDDLNYRALDPSTGTKASTSLSV